MKEIQFQRGGHPHGECCVCFIVRRGGIKVSTKAEIMAVGQPLALRLALKEQSGRSVNSARHKINKSQTACSPAQWLCFCCYTWGSHNERSTTERWNDWREGTSSSIRPEKTKHLLTRGGLSPSNWCNRVTSYTKNVVVPISVPLPSLMACCQAFLKIIKPEWRWVSLTVYTARLKKLKKTADGCTCTPQNMSNWWLREDEWELR